MARYLTATRIQASIQALEDTRAKSSLMEFLILKRSLLIKGASTAAIAQIKY